MSVKIIFEDSESTPISMMLKQSVMGESIFFSEGCEKLLDKVFEIYNDGDFIVIYYDVAPNNNKTINGYQNLYHRLRSFRFLQFSLVPIVCIEFEITKMLQEYEQLIVARKYDDLKACIGAIPDWEVYTSLKSNTYLSDSIEHFYKFILAQVQPQLCKRNAHKYVNGAIDWECGSGKYYYNDCPCDYHCTLNCTDSLCLKANRAYTALPLVVLENDLQVQELEQFDIQLQLSKLGTVQREREIFYTRLCNCLSVNMFHIFVDINSVANIHNYKKVGKSSVTNNFPSLHKITSF